MNIHSLYMYVGNLQILINFNVLMTTRLEMDVKKLENHITLFMTSI
jgi:hypothetical protein